MANPAAVEQAGAGEMHATIEHDAAHGAEHAAPVAFGIVGPAAWVSLAMLVFLGILIWKKVPGVIVGGLDSKIAEIKKQLEEARSLRAEAEGLRKEYAEKIANAEKDAAAMLEHAKVEATQIVAKAEADSEAMIVRRQKMAEDKIAAAERGAVDELRAKAASAAAAAARGLISEKHDAAADRKLVDEAIGSI
jgi:F-type H+-transporting ATPase subunit b